MNLRILFISLLSLVSIIGYAQNLRLVSDNWPPFTGIENSSARFAIDLVEEALSRSGMESEYEIIQFNQVIEGIKSEEYQGSAALWINDERKEYLSFSEPYLYNQLVLVGRKGSNVNLYSVDQLVGKKVALVSSYAYGEEIEGAEMVRWIPGKSDQENLEKLLRSEVDYMLVDDLLMQYVLKYQREKATQFLEVGSVPLVTRSLHFALSKSYPNSAMIIENFNREINGMMSDGSYNQILQLDWINADVDGDGTPELVLNGERAGTSAPQNIYDVYFSQNENPVRNVENRYYIEGQIYQGWDNVPVKYKAPPIKTESLNRAEALTLKF